MTLEVVADTGHIHEHQVAITAAEIVFNLVVSPELAFLKLSGALGALGLPFPPEVFQTVSHSLKVVLTAVLDDFFPHISDG